jgi:hypothetical protein
MWSKALFLPRMNEQGSVISGRWSGFRSQLRSSFGGIGKASYGQLPYPSKIQKGLPETGFRRLIN